MVKKISADEVAKDVAHAFTSAKPKTYYIVGIETNPKTWKIINGKENES